MSTVHEYDTWEGSALLATEDHDAFPGPRQEDVMRTLQPEVSPWELPDDAAAPAADEPASPRASDPAGSALDTMIAQYFGEVRQFARLSGPEEYALARRIERWQRRVRWTLYTTPVALPTLRTLWAQVVAQALPVDAVVQPLDASPALPAQQAPVQQALQQLHALAARLDAEGGPACATAQEQRGRRHARCGLWRAWLTTWDALRVQPQVQTALAAALAAAWQRQPEDPALQRGYQAWTRAQRELDQAKAQMMQANLRLVIHVAKPYVSPRPALARPDPGGQSWADARGGQVRAAPGAEVCDVCPLVDSPGHHPRAR